MDHTYHCVDEVPNKSAWRDIEQATFFDIKLVTSYPLSVYKPIIDKIGEITEMHNCIIHFSNELRHEFTEDHKKMFWEILKLLEGKKYWLEFQVKTTPEVKGTTFIVDKEFFEEIKQYENDNVTIVKLSTADKDDTDYTYFKLDKYPD